MTAPRPERTGDGSLTLHHPRYGQTYHSRHGAVTESRHVFLEQGGVAERLAAGRSVRVLEVGFGLGLNFLLGADLALAHDTRFDYLGLEAELLPRARIAALDQARWLAHPELHEALLAALPEAPPATGEIAFRLGVVRARILLGDARETVWPGPFDAVWLDAFSPDANPELWTTDFLARLAGVLAPGGVLSTYSARGSVRRALQAAGLVVEKRPGPPGKREMLVARKA